MDLQGIVTPLENDGDDYVTDLLDSDLQGLDQGGQRHDWSRGENMPLMAALNEYTASYCISNSGKSC